MIKNTLLLTLLLSVFANTSDAQNYYPADVGNIWVLESEDRTERITYVIGKTDEHFNGEQGRILRSTTAVLGTTAANVSTIFIQVDPEGLKVHKMIIESGDVFGTINLEFSPPAIFFPAPLELSKTWEIRGEAEVVIVGPLTVTTMNEVIAIEDVDTPAGSFKDCLKIQTKSKSVAALGSTRSTSYQWLAPDVGPVKFQTDQDIVFELISSNLLPNKLPYDVNADGVVNILDLTFVAARFGGADPKADINADGTVNILDLTLIVQNFGN